MRFNENSENCFNEPLKLQKVWENLVLPKDYCMQNQMPYVPMIFFVITGGVNVRINHLEQYEVLAQEMFLIETDKSYELTMTEQSHLMICYIPVEVWYSEQKQIDELILETKTGKEEFVKLSVKKIITRYLFVLDLYIKEGISSISFLELKRQELFFLLFFCYSKHDLARFLQNIICENMQFKKFVMDNYLNVGNVQELAKLANYSTSGFIKKFQKYFKESPYRWMQKQKAKQIYIEINQGIKSLQEIANEYQFSSYQHFAVFCKTHWGLPPTEILNKNELKKENEHD